MNITEEQEVTLKASAINTQLNDLSTAIQQIKIMVNNAKKMEDLEKANTYLEYSLNNCMGYINNSKKAESTKQK